MKEKGAWKTFGGQGPHKRMFLLLGWRLKATSNERRDTMSVVFLLVSGLRKFGRWNGSWMTLLEQNNKSSWREDFWQKEGFSFHIASCQSLYNREFRTWAAMFFAKSQMQQLFKLSENSTLISTKRKGAKRPEAINDLYQMSDFPRAIYNKMVIAPSEEQL